MMKWIAAGVALIVALCGVVVVVPVMVVLGSAAASAASECTTGEGELPTGGVAPDPDALRELAGKPLAQALAQLPPARNSEKGLQPNTRDVLRLLEYLYPYFAKTGEIGGYRDPIAIDQQLGISWHTDGVALDVMMPSGGTTPESINLGNSVANMMIANSSQLGIANMLWQQKIWTSASQEWVPTKDYGNRTDNHMDHVHIQVDGSHTATGTLTVPRSVSAPAPDVPSGTGGATVFIVGDSLTVGAQPELRKQLAARHIGGVINAIDGPRTTSDAITALRSRDAIKASSWVIAVGTFDLVMTAKYSSYILQVLNLAGGRSVRWLTVHSPNQSAVNTALQKAAVQNPDQLTVVDYASAVDRTSNYLKSDGVSLTAAGYKWRAGFYLPRVKKDPASSSPSTTAAAVGTTYGDWARALLSRGRFPTTADNVLAITAWQAQESGVRAGAFNPMNTTQEMPGATNYNTVGVKNYTSWNQGLDATLKTLNLGFYKGIRASLSGERSTQATFNAIIASKWGTKHFGAPAGYKQWLTKKLPDYGSDGGSFDPGQVVEPETCGSADIGDLGEPIPGTGFTDGPIDPKMRPVSQILQVFARAKSNPGSVLGGSFEGMCLNWAEELAGYHAKGVFGDNPEHVWAQWPQLQRPNRTPPPGALLLYRAGGSNQFHAVVYLGGGRIISTDMAPNGEYQRNTLNIAPADSVDKKWSGADRYLGWLAMP